MGMQRIHDPAVRDSAQAESLVDEFIAADAHTDETDSPLQDKSGPGRSTSTHVYVDEAGEAIFQVVIETTLTGTQQAFIEPFGLDGQPVRNGTRGIRHVLFRLPRVIDAVQSLTPIFVVSDEVTVEAIERLGVVATTCPRGTQAWQEQQIETLVGANVVVLSSGDPYGEQHAQAARKALEGVARTLRVVRLPAPEGLAQYFASETSRDALLEHLHINPSDPAIPRGVVQVGAQPVPTLDPAAFHGVFGRAVRVLEPTTEAEPAAILASLLVGFGAMCGHSPHIARGTERFPAKDFVLVVGASAKARKGTSWSVARHLLERVDEPFFRGKEMRIATGLSTGEGLIARVRDDQPQLGIATSDERLLVIEAEWARVLRASDRPGNNLSAIVREAWDLSAIGITTKTDPISASRHHIALIGHITSEELKSEFAGSVAISNGLANRHVFVFVQRTKVLPSPPPLDEVALGLVASDLRDAMLQARTRGHVAMSPAAEHMWRGIYDNTERAEAVGILGQLTARASAHILRLALIYALGDTADRIEPDHLKAAHALWRYSEASVLHIFGRRLNDAAAQKILDELHRVGDRGLTAAQQYRLFDNNISAERREKAVQLLEAAGLAHQVKVPAGDAGRGRPATVLLLGPAQHPAK